MLVLAPEDEDSRATLLEPLNILLFCYWNTLHHTTPIGSGCSASIMSPPDVRHAPCSLDVLIVGAGLLVFQALQRPLLFR